MLFFDFKNERFRVQDKVNKERRRRGFVLESTISIRNYILKTYGSFSNICHIIFLTDFLRQK